MRPPALLLGLLLASGCVPFVPPQTAVAPEAERRQRVYAELVRRGATPEEARASLEAAYGRTAVTDQVRRTSRADSLLTLGPNALTEADARWLMVYLAERDVASREIERARADRRYSKTWTALAIVGWATLTVAGVVAVREVF